MRPVRLMIESPVGGMLIRAATVIGIAAGVTIPLLMRAGG